MFISENDRNEFYIKMYKISESLYKQSREGKNFNNITKLIFTKENMFLAFREMKNNKDFLDNSIFKELINIDSDELFRVLKDYESDKNMCILKNNTHKLIHSSKYMNENEFNELFPNGFYKRYKDLKMKITK